MVIYMKCSQSYYCNNCEKFVITYTTHLNPEYSGTFWGYPVKKRDSYCPYCGHKSSSGEMPPIEYIQSTFGVDDEDENDESGFNYEEEVDDEVNDEEEYDEHDWCLPEDDASVRMFLCESCGEYFKIGYCDGRKRKALCPLCGGNAKRVKDN